MRLMNGKSKILLGLLTILLTMSIGYALFSKEITIGGNVTAKGSFKMDITCTKSISSEFVTAGYATTADINAMQHGYSTDTCSVSGSTVTMNTTLKYPGASRYYTIVIKNSGDIPAKWHYEDGFEFNYILCNGSNASECVDFADDMEQSNGFIAFSDILWGLVPGIRHGAKKSASGTFTVIIDKEITEVVDSDGYIYLQPGESLYFIANNLWRANDYDTDSYNYAYGNYQTFKPTFKFHFEQATE